MTSGAASTETERRTSIFLSSFLLLAVLRLWVCQMPSPLWVDEGGSYWVTTGNFAEVYQRWSQGLFPQMPLFVLQAWAFRQILGESEFALRIPSLLFSLGTLLMFFRFGRERKLLFLGPLAGLAYLSLPDSNRLAVDFRHYAPGLFFATGAILQRLNWMETRTLRPLLTYGALLSVSFHYSFFFCWLGLADAIALVLLWPMLRFRWEVLLSVLAAIPGTALLIPFILRNLREAHLHTMDIGLPGVDELFGRIFAPIVLIGLIAVIGRVLLTARRITATPDPSWVRELVYLLTVLFIPAVGSYLVSVATGSTFYVPRYVAVMALAQALFSARALSSLPWPQVSALLGVIAVAWQIGSLPFTLWVPHDESMDWKQAAALERSLVQKYPGTMVLVYSPFVEANRIPLPAKPEDRDLLLSQFSKYPLMGEVHLLPPWPPYEADEYVQSLLRQARTQPRVLVIGAYWWKTLILTVLSSFENHKVEIFDETPVVAFLQQKQSP